jgi:hypothetical protein
VVGELVGDIKDSVVGLQNENSSPFKMSVKHEALNPFGVKPPRRGPKDYRISKISKQFYRPYFSPHTNSYEMDYCTSTNIAGKERWWLAVININTKFLFMYPLEINTHATEDFTAKALAYIQDQLPEDQKIDNLRSDAGGHFPTIISEARGVFVRGNYFAKTAQSEAILDFLKKNNIKFFPFSSQFTNKSRVVDRAIRTIRDMLGDDFNKFLNPQDVSKAVDVYNNTPHRAFNYLFTPTEVQNNKDIEEFFIRENLYKLDDVRNKQIEAGFLIYKPGNIL